MRETRPVVTEPPGPNAEQLKMIQAVITRLAGNAFLVKGWTVTLVAGLAAIAKVDGNRDAAWISCGVVAIFALLDAYYLALERMFRKVYERQATSGGPNDWSLKPNADEQVGVAEVVEALMRFAVWPFYVAALVGSIAVALTIV